MDKLGTANHISKPVRGKYEGLNPQRIHKGQYRHIVFTVSS